ncbi:EAL domain-containing protein [Neptunomonas antarctica]|uniref:PAS domain S-box-containing protein/diguanylate cyclase (GGDEF) domain-containing protein n=1 Tax=Neptunomonas antarctica TaxID=619304 RepID=A0A1N7N9L7_9GAMM|nr:EAL domain-containing protein [Neptunomonas antarctica]SIS95006.1 PAS domain S-box-containing protein/diguanylate cyclase (GGDEF) domain-containing protein [Neptunomonas antarctica]
MILFTRISLQRSILLLIMTLSCVLVSFNYFVLRPQFESIMLEHSRLDIISTMNRLQGSIEYMLRNDDVDGMKREVAANSVKEEVMHLIVFDDQLRAVASSQLADQGRHYSELTLHAAKNMMEDVLVKRTRKLYESRSVENSLYGIAPIHILGSEGIRDSRWGLLVIEVDLSVRQSELLSEMDWFFWQATFLLALMGGLFWLGFQKSVNRRLAIIITAAQRIAEGEFHTRLSFTGKDELSEIAGAMDFMAGKIEEDHKELVSRHKELDSILRNIPSMVYIKDVNGQYLMVNDRFKAAFPSVELATNQTVFNILPCDEAEKFTRYDAEVLETGEALSKRVSFTYHNEIRHLFMVKFPLYDTDKLAYAICTMATDLSEQEQTENLLNISKSIFENAVDTIVIMDEERRIIDVNQSFENVTGYSKKEVVGKGSDFITLCETNTETYQEMWLSLFDKGHWIGEIINHRKNGEEYFERLSINSINNRDGEITGYIGISQDITQEKEARQNLARLAFRDSLTGLHNRESFKNHLIDAAEYTERYGKSFGVLFIDLDFFKEVNDSQGHDFGDLLLKMVADRLVQGTRAMDVVSRLGGDEFTILMPGNVSDAGLAASACQIVKKLSEPYCIEGADLVIGCSIGIAVFPRDGSDIDLLLKHADAAMYHAKELGRGRFSFFNFSINEKNQRLIAVKNALRSAIDNAEYRLVYQPKVDPHKGVITGYEALLRWDSKGLGMVSPAEFIPIAEESTEIENITDWVIKCVTKDKQQSVKLRHANVAINISAKQFKSDSWVNTLRDMDGNGQLNVALITVEVTETALIDSFENTLVQLSALRHLGATIAIDDFGIGYSSLSYLKKMPIDYVKIDRSFVQDIVNDPDDQAIVQTVITMSHALDIKVIAEGAESVEQVTFLKSRGCDEIQGYFYAKPLELSQVDDFNLAASKT